jgi:hypothetical protein
VSRHRYLPLFGQAPNGTPLPTVDLDHSPQVHTNCLLITQHQHITRPCHPPHTIPLSRPLMPWKNDCNAFVFCSAGPLPLPTRSTTTKRPPTQPQLNQSLPAYKHYNPPSTLSCPTPNPLGTLLHCVTLACPTTCFRPA